MGDEFQFLIRSCKKKKLGFIFPHELIRDLIFDDVKDAIEDDEE